MKITSNKAFILASITILFLTLSSNSLAKIYKWIDENGQTHYTAQPPAQKIKSKNIEDKIKGTTQVYGFGDGSINIPIGFKGPIKQDMGQGASSTAFSFPHKQGGATLFQITTFNPDQSLPEMPENELKDASKQYLLEFLEGIKRKRNNFKQGQVNFIQVSGHPIAKVSWSGKAQGKNVHGVMYSLIFNSKIYSFHTQDLSSFNEKYTSLAVKAFESIKLKR